MIKKLRGRLQKAFLANPYIATRTAAAVSALLVGGSFCFGPKTWHSGHSFYYINLLRIPWQIYGFWLVLAGFCLFFKKTRSIACLIGGIAYTFFALSSWLATVTGHVNSLFAPCNFTTIAIFYWSALKVYIYEQAEFEDKVEH